MTDHSPGGPTAEPPLDGAVPARPAGTHRADGGGRRPLSWRVATPLALAAGGVLLATSGVNSAGTDLRAGRYDDLSGLARQESARVQQLRDQVTELQAEVERLSAGVQSGALADLERRVAAVAEPAGLTAVEGPGLTVTLDDAPDAVLEGAGDQVSNAIVHQQDIQGVVNALWAGGAEAMTVQGQRVVSTTGIKCVGNTVVLHGVPYSPPYVVSAIGDPERLLRAVETSPAVIAYLQAVQEWRLSWDVQARRLVRAPAFEGLTETRWASAPAG